MDNSKTANTIKYVRIYQIIPIESEYTFKNYAGIISNGLSAPPAKIYQTVYDSQLGTDNLEEIWYIFNEDHPNDYLARSLSVSDIVEIYDNNSSSFYYCDEAGFKEVRFTPVKRWYLLLSSIERDMADPQIFTSLAKARKKMMDEMMNLLDPIKDYSKNDDYGFNDYSAWANKSDNYDWRIVCLSMDEKGVIKTVGFGQEGNS